MFASQSLEVRHDAVLREDSTGSLWGPVSAYRGDLLTVPASGKESRTCEFLVKACRNNPYTGADTGIDDISARLYVTPRGLVV